MGTVNVRLDELQPAAQSTLSVDPRELQAAPPQEQQAQQPQRLSDSLPQPDQAVQDATQNARILTYVMTTPGALPGMGGGLPPGPPRPPIAPGLPAPPPLGPPSRPLVTARSLGLTQPAAQILADQPLSPNSRMVGGQRVNVIPSQILRVAPPPVDDRSDVRKFLETPLISGEDIDKALPFLVGPFALHKGIIKGAAGMTSPESAGILAATGGASMAAEGLTGAAAAAHRIASAGLSAYFGTQAGKSLLDAKPEMRAAWNAGDVQGVLETGGKQLVNAATVVLSGLHVGVEGIRAFREIAPRLARPPKPSEPQYTTTGQLIRSVPESELTAVSPKETTHEETQVSGTQGRPGPGARAVEPGPAVRPADDAAGQQAGAPAGPAQAVPATQTEVAPPKPLKPGSTPPVVYHGTGDEFGQFEDGRAKDGSLYGPGYYHTEDPAVASTYAKGGAAPNVRPSKLDIRNVFDVDRPADPKLARIIDSKATTNDELYHDAVEHFGDKSEVNDWLAANGYDGITHVGGKLAGKGKRLHRVWIALHPDQVQPGFQATETPPTRASFETSQGSTYTVDGESTTRTKSLHKGHDPADVGTKEPSQKTVYVDPKFATEVGMWNTSSASGKRIVLRDGKAMLVSENPASGQLGRDRPVNDDSFTTEPAVGRAPLELTNADESGHYRGNHPGNVITKVSPAPAESTPGGPPGEPAPAVPPQEPSVLDRLDQAGHEAMQRLRDRGFMAGGRLSANAFFDPETVKDLAISIAGDVARGTLQFKEWAKAMVAEHGPAVEDALREVWESARAIGERAFKDVKRRSMQDLDVRIPSDVRVVSPDPTKTVTGEPFHSLDLDKPSEGFLPLRKAGLSATSDALRHRIQVATANQMVNQAWQESIRESEGPGGTTAAEAVRETGARPPDAEFWDKSFSLPQRARFWYELSGESLTKEHTDIPREEQPKFIDAVAGTSGGVEPRPNLERAIGITAERLQKTPVMTDLRDPASARKAMAPGTQIPTLKYGSFSGTMKYTSGLGGKKPLTTNDVQVASMFGIKGEDIGKNPIMYEVLSRFFLKLRDMQNALIDKGAQPWETWQEQAPSWVYERIRKNPAKASEYDDYSQVFPKVIEKLRAAGIPVPGNKVTMETLLDPRTPNVMSGTRERFQGTPVATVETATELTKKGAAAADTARELAKLDQKIPWVRNHAKEYVDIQRRAMRRLAQRSAEGPSLVSKLMSAITGRKVDVSRLDWEGYGTFEGTVSPNLRIPLTGRQSSGAFRDLDSIERKAFLAILGQDLNQAAMAASHFSLPKAGQAPDTFSIFIEHYEGEIDPQAIGEFSRRLGYPVNVVKYPNGTGIDINVGGFDTKPTPAQVEAAYNESALPAAGDKGQRLVVTPRTYSGDYLEKGDYPNAVKGLALRNRRGVASHGSAGDLHGDLTSARKAIREVAKQRDSELADWTDRSKDRLPDVTPPAGDGGVPAEVAGAQAEVPASSAPTSLSDALQKKADAALERVRQRGTLSGTKLSGGLPIDDLADMATWGAFKIAKGTVDFANWSKEMVSDLGEQIRPHLENLYARAQSIYAEHQGRPSEAPPNPNGESAFRQFMGDERGTSKVGAILAADLDEMRSLKEKRAAALAAMEAAKETPGEKAFGEKVRSYFMGERDLWATRVNQVIYRLRRMVPDVSEQEGLALMREFRNRPNEMEKFLDGTHIAMATLGPDEHALAMKNINRLRPAIEKALNPTPRMVAADQTLTQIADGTLREGQKLGFLDSRWTPQEYVTHLLHPKGEGEVATPRNDPGQQMGGKIGKFFAFALRRSDPYPTLLHAVADNVVPKTLNAFDAFTIHGDKFATARATHLLENQLRDTGIGKYAVKENAPDGWVQLAPQSNEFRQVTPYIDQATGLPDIAEKRLYVPPFVEKALKPITDPNFGSKIIGFTKLRSYQAYLKAAQLGMSLFHATTENYMAMSNMGPRGWIQGLRADRANPDFLRAERDFVIHGGTSPIQGKTVEAYRSLQPGSIPTWTDIWKRAPVLREVDELARHVTDFTFGKLQRQFKVTDYQMHVSGWMADHPNATPAELRDAKQSIAKEVNAVYGGLNTEALGINKTSMEMARAIMLAPDWTFSNIFNLKYSAERGTPAGKLARAFWMRQMVGGIIATQLASLMFSRGQLSPQLTHPGGAGDALKGLTQVYMGKDPKGQDIHQNVFFKGASGDVLNLLNNVHDYGAVEGLGRSMSGKAAPAVRTVLQTLVNRDYLGGEIVPKGMDPIAGTVRGAYNIGKSLAPVPLSLGTLKDMLIGPQADQYTAPEFGTTLFAGTPPHHAPPAGMRMTKHGLAPLRQKARQSIWDEIVTGKR